MTFAFGYILIKGNHVSSIDNILLSFHYNLKTTERTKSFQEAQSLTFKSNDSFAIGVDKGWTIIYDPHAKVLQSDENYENWMNWSSILSTEIFIWETLSSITKNILFYFNNGQILRGYYNIDCELKVNIGELLPGEQKYKHRDMKYEYYEYVLEDIMKSTTGIDETEAKNAVECMVKITDYNRRAYLMSPRKHIWGLSKL